MALETMITHAIALWKVKFLSRTLRMERGTTLVHPLMTDMMLRQTGSNIKMQLKLMGSAGPLAKAKASLM
jgi:hypothetical protein